MPGTLFLIAPTAQLLSLEIFLYPIFHKEVLHDLETSLLSAAETAQILFLVTLFLVG